MDLYLIYFFFSRKLTGRREEKTKQNKIKYNVDWVTENKNSKFICLFAVCIKQKYTREVIALQWRIFVIGRYGRNCY